MRLLRGVGHVPLLCVWWLLVVACLLPSSTPIIASAADTSSSSVSGSAPLTKYQEKVNHAWNNLVSDFDGLKALFADNAKIKMCLQGMPFCTEGTFVEMLEGYRVAFVSFQVKHKFLTGASHPQDTFLVEWVNSIETQISGSGQQRQLCKAMWWGYATYEFNDQGKIKRFVGMSEDSQDVLHCISKVSGINAEL